VKTIVAIDPGPEESTIVEVAREPFSIASKFTASNREARDWINQHSSLAGGFEVVCEEVKSFGMPVGVEVFNTVLAVGRFMQLCEARGVNFHLVGRQEVKLFWCKSARAKDSNVRQALIDHYGKAGTKKDPGGTYGISSHLWSALAIAGYWACGR
jgi:hypothetical protein